MIEWYKRNQGGRCWGMSKLIEIHTRSVSVPTYNKKFPLWPVGQDQRRAQRRHQDAQNHLDEDHRAVKIASHLLIRNRTPNAKRNNPRKLFSHVVHYPSQPWPHEERGVYHFLAVQKMADRLYRVFLYQIASHQRCGGLIVVAHLGKPGGNF